MALTMRPLCRYCGKPIPKRTHTVSFSSTGTSSDYWTVIDAKPRSKEEAQRLVNQEIVSVKWFRTKPAASDSWRRDYDPGFDYIQSVGTWDGESYADKFFCNGSHAQSFAYGVLNTGAYKNLGMYDWHKALDKQLTFVLRASK